MTRLRVTPETPLEEAPGVLLPAEAALLLRCSVRTIERRIADGTLETFDVSPRVRRIRRSSLLALTGGQK